MIHLDSALSQGIDPIHQDATRDSFGTASFSKPERLPLKSIAVSERPLGCPAASETVDESGSDWVPSAQRHRNAVGQFLERDRSQCRDRDNRVAFGFDELVRKGREAIGLLRRKALLESIFWPSTSSRSWNALRRTLR